MAGDPGAGMRTHRRMDIEAQKRAAGEAAIEYVEDDAVIGVGTGSTVAYFIDALARMKHRIKGGGGALTREKIVAAAAKKFVCIGDAHKCVNVLGRFPLPVEVILMARSLVAREILQRGGQPVWREGVITDNGNWILDVHGLRIDDPPGLESDWNQIAGVVTVGLFAHRPADVVLVGDGRKF